MTYQKEELTFPRATSRSRRTEDKWGTDTKKKIYDIDWANWPSAASQDQCLVSQHNEPSHCRRTVPTSVIKTQGGGPHDVIYWSFLEIILIIFPLFSFSFVNFSVFLLPFFSSLHSSLLVLLLDLASNYSDWSNYDAWRERKRERERVKKIRWKKNIVAVGLGDVYGWLCQGGRETNMAGLLCG